MLNTVCDKCAHRQNSKGVGDGLTVSNPFFCLIKRSFKRSAKQFLSNQLCQLNGVQSRSLAQVIAADDKHDSTVIRNRLILTNTADEDIVFARGLERGRNIDNANAGGAAKRSHGLVTRNRGGELSVNGHGVRGQDRHAHAGPAHQKIWDVKDTTRFIAKLLLFVGLKAAVIDNRAGQRNDIESDGRDVDLRGAEINSVTVGREPLKILISSSTDLVDELANTLEA